VYQAAVRTGYDLVTLRNILEFATRVAGKKAFADQLVRRVNADPYTKLQGSGRKFQTVDIDDVDDAVTLFLKTEGVSAAAKEARVSCHRLRDELRRRRRLYDYCKTRHRAFSADIKDAIAYLHATSKRTWGRKP
jgi:hypothetical protein